MVFRCYVIKVPAKTDIWEFGVVVLVKVEVEVTIPKLEAKPKNRDISRSL